MGGDHKCPVCQATFTRPQHVARHMRSHTGDRPYKCQHCGDQFARSDLLSRHVNKCHAGEKSIGGTGNTRRKGGASATRATTSKQACDQCVQGSLPCDGCNPCAKCVQRKCRCTYVKFHRQTAPIGPGHNPRPSTASSTSSLSSLSSVSSTSAGLTGAAMIPPGVYGHYPPPTGHYPNASYAPGPNIVGYGDDTASSNLNPLLLGPAPGSTIPNISSQHPTDPSSSSSATGYSGSFTFPPVFPPRDDRGYESDYDYTTKYRAQAAELMRRGSMPSTASSQPEWWSDGGGVGNYYGVYYRPGSSHGHGDESDSGTSSATSSSVHLPLVGAEDHHQQYLLNGHGHHHARHDSSASPPSGILHPHTHVSPQHISPPHAHAQAHAIPPHSASTDGSRPNTSNGFSNAFGLMSLDDPNVLAGLASDGQPFFSAFETLEQLQNHQQQQRNREEDPNVTPMPRFTNGSPHQGATALPSVAVTGSGTGQSTGQRPSTSGGYPPAAHHQPQQFPVTPREQETRELREFWKAYMRTPLTGGGPLGGPAPAPTSSTNSNSVSPPNVNGNGDIHMLSPGPSVIGAYRRQRVSSLPSVKTPTEEGAYYYGPSSTWAPNGTNGTGGIGPKSNSNPNTGTNPLAPLHGHGYHSMHSIIQQPSSNQAALGNMRTPHPQQQQQVSMTGVDDLKSYEAAVLARKAPTNLNLVPKMRRGNKPPSGQQQQSTNGTTNNRVSFAPGTASDTTTTGTPATSPSKRRPSFKRLPSQTLESGVEKRQRWKGSFDDQDDGEDEGADGDESSGDEGGSAESSGGSVGLPAASSGGVRLVALDANTGSAPSVSPPAVGGGATMMAAGAA